MGEFDRFAFSAHPAIDSGELIEVVNDAGSGR